jgi:hypothetical protein
MMEGIYVFPKDTDPATRLLLEDAAMTFKKLSGKEVNSYIIVNNAQNYWQQVNDWTLSSYSGFRFGRYKSVSFNHDLSVLHTAKLSAMVEQ